MEKDLLEEQARLQKEAHELLAELDLLQMLGKFGKPFIVGSLALGTMTWQDIDVEAVVQDPTLEKLLELTEHYLKHPSVRNVTVSNNLGNRIYPYYPEGVYLGLKTVEQKGRGQWKLDIWLLKKDQKSAKDDLEWLKKGITDQRRTIILQIKNQIVTHPHYRKDLSAKDVYKAVIDNEVTDLEGFKKYLTKIDHPVKL
jgi:hypothetical protein